MIEPPLDKHDLYEPGACIKVGLVIGRAIDSLPDFIYAFEQLGGAGLGPGRGRFRVDSVSAAPLGGPAAMIYDDSKRSLATRIDTFGCDGGMSSVDGDPFGLDHRKVHHPDTRDVQR